MGSWRSDSPAAGGCRAAGHHVFLFWRQHHAGRRKGRSAVWHDSRLLRAVVQRSTDHRPRNRRGHVRENHRQYALHACNTVKNHVAAGQRAGGLQKSGWLLLQSAVCNAQARAWRRAGSYHGRTQTDDRRQGKLLVCADSGAGRRHRAAARHTDCRIRNGCRHD